MVRRRRRPLTPQRCGVSAALRSLSVWNPGLVRASAERPDTRANRRIRGNCRRVAEKLDRDLSTCDLETNTTFDDADDGRARRADRVAARTNLDAVRLDRIF